MTMQPLSLFLAQIIVIVLVSRVFGSLARRIGQPSVIGEMFAGVFLGPSIAGAAFPAFSATLFPATSLGALQMLSQVGVLLFLFVVGMELDTQLLRSKARTALVVSPAGIIIPFILGVVLSLYLFPNYRQPGGNILPFALFMGIAMSITAFPVLVRILDEKGLTQSVMGTLAITCAAIDDATAWCLLAIIVAIAKSAWVLSAVWVVGGAVLFTVAMLFALRPVIRYVYERFSGGEGSEPRKSAAALILVLLFASALATELIGIHALFGAFLAGVIVPKKPELQKHLRERFEYFSTIFLLPIFFAFTGLRTHIGLLNDAQSALVCALIIAVAVAGKFGGGTLAARFTGLGWREASALGVLMNTRGLMELIVLNIGYDLGILSPVIFTMLVIMALVTTFMTSPLLSVLKVG
jgi:Kef-type K+ transport system membrane component KefB